MRPSHANRISETGTTSILAIRRRRTEWPQKPVSGPVKRLTTGNDSAMAVLITGGTKGIGLAIARRFAKPGVDIFMAYKRDDAAAAAAIADIAALGARPHALKADVSTPTGARALLL